MSFPVSVYVLLLAVGSAVECEAWDHFSFAQSWPPATCAEAPHEHHICHIPPAVKAWTVHGLWPDTYGQKSPEFCNDTWTFDPKKLEPILGDMELKWTNLYNDTKPYSFWEHEWEKHGTCCTDLASTKGELFYFSTGLKLAQEFNIIKMLADRGILPSDTATYSLKDFQEAIKSAVDYYPVVECTMMTDPKTGEKKHIISQIEICLTKTLEATSCTSSRSTSEDELKKVDSTLYFKPSVVRDDPPPSTCSKSKDFYYPPIIYV